MKFPKLLAITIVMLSFCVSANAQLWRSINDSPEKEKAAELALEREASSVKEMPIVEFGDTLSYTLITYDLQSFDGKICRIIAAQKPGTKRLNISYGNDSLVLVDVMGMDSVHFLNKNFLEIIYSPRGDSDDGFQNTIVLCIKKGKLHVAMEVESDHQFDGPGLWGEYHLTAKFSEDSKDNYKLLIKTNDRYYSETHPKKNHNIRAKHTVRFDAQKKIFYNVYRDVNAVVGDGEVPGYKTESKTKPEYIKGHYPAIVLGDQQYYYIKNSWYFARKWFDGKIHLDSDID